MILQMIPNFYILGAAKAGTTTLYEILKQHPQIYLSYVKEPMFFSHDDNYQQGVEWYASTFFPKAGGFRLRGEATPHYLYWAEKVAPRIKELYGEAEVKFIAIFRDPVQRAYSWYWNMVKEGKEDLSFAQALEKEPERLKAHWETLYQAGAMAYGYYRGGCYASQIEQYLQLFPRERFFFLLQEDLKDLKSEAFNRFIEFLDVDRSFRFTHTVSNPAALPRSRTLHAWLHGRSALKDLIKKVVPLPLRYYSKVALTEVNMQAITYPPLDESTAKGLMARYRDEITRLETLIGRDLSHWKG